MNELLIQEPEKMTAEELGWEIRNLTRQARGMALSFGIQIGYRLKLAHEKVGPHGWADWLKAETDFSAPAASRFEKLYAEYGAAQGSIFGAENNFPTLEKISISKALRLISIPEEERESFAEEVDAEHLSTKELEEAIRQRDESRRQTEEAEKTIAGLQAEVEQANAAVKAAEAVSAEISATNGGLNEKLLKLTEEKEELKQQLKQLAEQPTEVTVKSDEETLKRKQQEIEHLKKQLLSASSGTREAAIYITAFQKNFAGGINKIREIHKEHPETAEKLAGGLLQILENLKGATEAMAKEWK